MASSAVKSSPIKSRTVRTRLLATMAAATVLVLVSTTAVPDRAGAQTTGAFRPIDAQRWENPDDMTWPDYRAVPGTDWADPGLTPSVRTFKGALVLLDYPDQDFVVTQPPHSTVFGNPQPTAANLPRTGVAAFYQDFLNKPEALNHGHTINEYWMEDSGGRLGVDLTGFGPYRLPAKSYQYGIDNSFNPDACPAGETCARNIRTDGRAAWVAGVGEDVASQFDFIFYLSAGQDESSTWQEFGQMRFAGPEQVPDDWGPPDEALPNSAHTRYVPWTSWKAAANIWPNAANGSSTQAESSGMATYAHEFSHILGIGDNYNNPYGTPLRRAYTGIWGMMSRGTFNGPGGPHTRWQIPPTNGSAMGAEHVLRDKMQLGIVDESNVLRLDRAALASSGLVVARVTARSAPPGEHGLAGINVAFGTDLSPACDPDTEVLCDGGGYQNYTVEVVDRMGADSFTPDHGVLLAKTKNADDTPFAWVIDANPQDIDVVDFTLPDGTPQKLTMGDYRQLSDALFHAGAGSGSEYEYVDQANRLHFYVVDPHRDSHGVLSYTVAVRSLDGSGAQRRGVALGRGNLRSGTCTFPIRNTGQGGGDPTGHPEDVSAYLGSDVYRLSATVSGAGWRAWLPNELTAVRAGAGATVQLAVTAGRGASRQATATLTARSESDPTKTATTTCHLTR